MASKLPKGWGQISLSELFSLIRGVSYSKQESSITNKQNYLPVLRANNISEGKINFEKLIYVNRRFVSEEQLLKSGDIVIAMSSGSKALVGKAAQLNKNWQGSFGAFCSVARPLNCIDSRYLAHYFQSEFYRGSISKLSSGININNLRQEYFDIIRIPLAPVQEQKRISSSLDKLFAELNSIQSRLDNFPKFILDFRQQIFLKAVDGTLTKKWRMIKQNKLSAKKYLLDILESRKKDYLKNNVEDSKSLDYLNYPIIDQTLKVTIPNNWVKSYFGNLGELTRGRSKNRPRNDPKLYNGKYPFIQTGDVTNSFIYVNDHKQTYNEKGLAQSRLFPAKTLCITIAANIAETAILSYPACFPDSIVGFIPYKQKYLPEIALYYFNVIQKELEDLAPATAQKNINVALLSKLPIPVPPLKEQKEIVKRVNKLFKQINKVEKQYQILKKKIDELPQIILSQAYSGKLVSQNPNDEPIEKLLARIKVEKAKLLEQQRTLKKKRFSKRAKKEEKMKDYIESNITLALQKNSDINMMDSFTFDDIWKIINEDYDYIKNNLFAELDKSKKDGLKVYYDRVERKIKFRLGDK